MGWSGAPNAPGADQVMKDQAKGLSDAKGAPTLKQYHLWSKQKDGLTNTGLETYRALRSQRLQEIESGLDAQQLLTTYGAKDFDQLLDMELEGKLKKKDDTPKPPALPDPTDAYQRALARGRTDRMLRMGGGRASYFGGVGF